MLQPAQMPPKNRTKGCTAWCFPEGPQQPPRSATAEGLRQTNGRAKVTDSKLSADQGHPVSLKGQATTELHLRSPHTHWMFLRQQLLCNRWTAGVQRARLKERLQSSCWKQKNCGGKKNTYSEGEDCAEAIATPVDSVTRAEALSPGPNSSCFLVAL